MKKINIVAASKIKQNSELFKLIQEYTKRFTRYSLNIIEFDEKNMSKAEITNKIFSLTSKKSFKILLSERAKQYTTLELSKYLDNITSDTVEFLIAGSDGFTEEAYQQVDTTLSLSKLTFPHQVARLILIEQLYRVQSILTNHPYHRE